MATNSPKTMSSRLMTMKFMQRSAARNTASSPSTPNGPPSKKMRMSNGASAPGTPDSEILQAALAAEEQKRQEALDKAAEHTGETKWVLSIQDTQQNKCQDTMKVTQAGFAELDADSGSEEEEEEVRPIRRQFGGGLKKPEKSVAFEKADESEADEDSSSEEYDSDDPTAALIRETKREVAAESRKARDAKTQQSKDLPRARGPHQDSSLKGLSSLSGAGQSSGRSSGGPRDMSNVDCYKCGKKGHLKSDCPQARGSAGRGNGRGRR